MSQLLLEIGLEEVPAGFMPQTLAQLKSHTETALKDARIDFESVRTLGTPRRLAVLVDGIAEKQKDLEEEVRGPSEKVAYDDEQKPTKALLGFMKGNQVSEEDIVIRDKYIYAVRKQTGEPTQAVLKKLLPDLILGLSFPKTMRWGAWETRYVRPIHWIVALLDADVIPFSIEMCKSDRLTRGHRFLGETSFAIASAGTYEEQLKGNFVIVDQDIRQKLIEEQIAELVESIEGKIQTDVALLEEIVYLVEYPTALMGYYDERFLDMPDELVITPMKEHQRYFPVLSATDGTLLNRFITVRNGSDEHLNIVQEGNERVLTARLADARFFYDEDLKIDPEEWLEKLKTVVFQEQLGTTYEKTERNEVLAQKIAHLLRADQTVIERAVRAAHLAKADLVSNVVTEFPELQGMIGEVYVTAFGKDDALTAQAVREHYLPRFAGDAIPETEAGRIVALSDKLDTIVGCFAVGIEPTGSQDPYALRRQASGVLNIILKSGQHVSLQSMISLAIEGLPQHLVNDAEELNDKVYSFFDQRIRTVLREQGYGAVFTEALLRSGYDDPLDTVIRAKEIDAYMKEHAKAFEALLVTYKRAYNLASKAEQVKVRPELFEADAEKDLYDAIRRASGGVQEKDDVASKLDTLQSLNAPVDRLFEDVMVMDERTDIKQNRLALLKLFTDITADIIDLSVL